MIHIFMHRKFSGEQYRLTTGTGGPGYVFGFFFTIIGLMLFLGLNVYIVGPILIGLGVIMLFLRWDTVFDTSKRTMAKSWGFAVPIVRRSVTDITSAKGVRVEKKRIGGFPRATSADYEIMLVADADPVHVWTEITPERAEEIAGELAKHLGIAKYPMIGLQG